MKNSCSEGHLHSGIVASQKVHPSIRVGQVIGVLMSIRKVTFVATLQVKLTAGGYYSSWGAGLALNEVKDCWKKTHFCENEQRFDGE